MFVVAQKRNMLPFSTKIKALHSFALLLATQEAYQARLNAPKVLTFLKRVLLLN